ncbi:hypothetical protein [Pedobacter lusitanus]|uniref:hypothetical protein n=1 Tax=Pedobacter lusitanus TaxID=1503925 RepID=UPI000696F579|nr:hypothetical protein [Pedobacter lusitanus]
MDQKIITKFKVATDDAINELLYLTKAITIEKYAGFVASDVIERYIADRYHDKQLIDEMNSFGNQWLVVYADGLAAGYAFLTTQGKRPRLLENKKAICIADFGVLQSHLSGAARQSLMDKCLSIGKSYEAIWFNEQNDSPLLSFFEDHSFIKMNEDHFLIHPDLKMACLIREN